jgi:Predicted transcriptional regulators
MAPCDYFEDYKKQIFMLYILKILHQGSAHCAELVKEIIKRTQGAFKPNINRIYPLLKLLEDLGYIKWECNNPNERGKRMYFITEDGVSYMLELESIVEYCIVKTERQVAVLRANLLGQ